MKIKYTITAMMLGAASLIAQEFWTQRDQNAFWEAHRAHQAQQQAQIDRGLESFRASQRQDATTIYQVQPIIVPRVIYFYEPYDCEY